MPAPPAHATLEHWLRQLLAGRFQDVVFLTGEGITQLLALSSKLGVGHELRAALARVRRIAAGPGPRLALDQLGLGPELWAYTAGSEGVIVALRKQALAGRHIGLQLSGESPERQLIFFLENEGAHVHAVAVDAREPL
jgi:uroporphyrinogen-III synthase